MKWKRKVSEKLLEVKSTIKSLSMYKENENIQNFCPLGFFYQIFNMLALLRRSEALRSRYYAAACNECQGPFLRLRAEWSNLLISRDIKSCLFIPQANV